MDSARLELEPRKRRWILLGALASALTAGTGLARLGSDGSSAEHRSAPADTTSPRKPGEARGAGALRRTLRLIDQADFSVWQRREGGRSWR